MRFYALVCPLLVTKIKININIYPFLVPKPWLFATKMERKFTTEDKLSSGDDLINVSVAPIKIFGF